MEAYCVEGEADISVTTQSEEKGGGQKRIPRGETHLGSKKTASPLNEPHPGGEQQDASKT